MSSSYVNGLVISSAYINGEHTLGYFNGVKIWGETGPVPVPAPSLTLISGNPTFTVKQETEITPIVYEWANADTVTVSNLHLGLSASIDDVAHRVTISGAPTANTSGDRTFTVTTSGGVGDEATMSGTISVTKIYTWSAAVTNSSSKTISFSNAVGASKSTYIFINKTPTTNGIVNFNSRSSINVRFPTSATTVMAPNSSIAYRFSLTNPSTSASATSAVFKSGSTSFSYSVLLRDGKLYQG